VKGAIVSAETTFDSTKETLQHILEDIKSGGLRDVHKFITTYS